MGIQLHLHFSQNCRVVTTILNEAVVVLLLDVTETSQYNSLRLDAMYTSAASYQPPVTKIT